MALLVTAKFSCQPLVLLFGSWRAAVPLPSMHLAGREQVSAADRSAKPDRIQVKRPPFKSSKCTSRWTGSSRKETRLIRPSWLWRKLVYFKMFLRLCVNTVFINCLKALWIGDLTGEYTLRNMSCPVLIEENMILLMYSVYKRARATYRLRHVILSNHLFNIAYFVKNAGHVLFKPTYNGNSWPGHIFSF